MSNYPFCKYTVYKKNLYINIENNICVIIKDKNMSYKETVKRMIICKVFDTLFMDNEHNKFIISHLVILNDAPECVKNKLDINN